MLPAAPLRILISVAAAVGLLLLIGLLLLFTDWALSVWARLQAAPVWFIALYGTLITGLTGSGGWVVYRLAKPHRKRGKRAAISRPPTEEELEHRLAKGEQAGLDVAAIRRELQELKQRRAAGEIHVALFGEISSGKSSMVRSLLPGVEVEVSPKGGTTRQVERYVWTSPAGDRLILTDLPGLNEAGGQLDDLAREEALRAHVVIYVCDGDLTRDQHQELQGLKELDKPIIVALNKIDLYTPEELTAIRQRLAERLAGMTRLEVVAISSGGSQEVFRVYPDGRQERGVRQLPPRVDHLALALQRQVDEDPTTLEKLRDSTVFVLAGRKLDEVLAANRRQKSEELITQYARKAVVGAMAAVAPGTDLLIQGYLGINLIKELCALHEVPAREIEIQRLLEMSGRHVGKTLPLMLAVIGNGLKAFPGIGTLAGGVLHAVAYGLVFDSLGHALAHTLENRGELAAAPTLLLFEEKLGEEVESRAKKLARMALTGTLQSNNNQQANSPASRGRG